MRFAVLPLSVLALTAAVPSLAADLVTASKIDAVTVYPDAASVTRIAEIDLPAGETTLVFKGLPVDIDPDSLRAAGEATAGLTIGAVESRVAPAEVPPDDGLEARLKALREDREAIQVTIDALDGKRTMIQHFAQSAPEKLILDGKPIELGQWDTAWDRVATALAKVGGELKDARDKARDLDANIKGLEASRQQPAQTIGPGRDVRVAIDADAGTKATVKLTYRVGDASWQPLYDARLTTSGTPSLELVRRAAISQRTGEAWTDVALSVSTVSTARGTAAPDMEPRRIAFLEEAEAALPPLRFHHKHATARLAPGAPAAAAPETALPEPPPKPAVEQQATLAAGAYEASFLVPGRITVPADGSEKSFRLDAKTVTPALTVKAVPALDPTAYLEARLVNDADAPLLPGDVHLLRDGTFVGTGEIPLVAPGDTMALGFGSDDRVKVVRVPVKRKENDPVWIGTNKTESDEFKTSVKNLHDFQIKVQVVDQIPFSETTTIVVEQLPATTPPTDKILNDKRGVMGWTFDLAPGATKEIHLAYRMKWPPDRDVAYEAVPVGQH